MLIYGFDQYGSSTVQAYFESSDPEPGPGLLLIEMTAAGVNPADIKVRSGMRKEQVEVTFPMALGREAAGMVRAIGAEVLDFAVGQRVFGQVAPGTGAIAEHVLLIAAASAVVPAGVTDVQATCIPVSVGTAFDAVDQLGLTADDTLLVLGAGGGVGSAACQIARLRTRRVIGVASRAKADTVTGLGATHVESGVGWIERVRTAAPEGVTAVLDTVGTGVLSDAFVLLGGSTRLLSAAAPGAAAGLGGAGIERRRTSEVYSTLAGLVSDGAISPLVSATFPFDRAADAVAAVESGHARGNVVVLGAHGH